MTIPSWEGLPDDAARAHATVDAWAASPALAQLVSACGGSDDLALGAVIGESGWNALDAFAGQHWDFRRGAERNLAPLTKLGEEFCQLVFSAGAELGQCSGPAPPTGHWDAIIMTGGMVRAGLVKPRYASELLRQGVTADQVVFLGGFRAFAGDEIPLARALGVDGDNETDAMMAGMISSFGLQDAPAVAEADNAARGTNAAWQEWSWQRESARFSVVAAPSSEPHRRRANTADTFRFWIERLKPAAVKRILLVTTPIYVPYQAAVGVQIFGVESGLAVQAVGTSEASNDLGRHTQIFEAQHYLQELRSAISALKQLRAVVLAL